MYANPLTAGLDMWEQMIGEANISWYDLGNKVLFMMVDSKSNISLFYHLPFINNKEGGGKRIRLWQYISNVYVDGIKKQH